MIRQRIGKYETCFNVFIITLEETKLCVENIPQNVDSAQFIVRLVFERVSVGFSVIHLLRYQLMLNKEIK